MKVELEPTNGVGLFSHDKQWLTVVGVCFLLVIATSLTAGLTHTVLVIALYIGWALLFADLLLVIWEIVKLFYRDHKDKKAEKDIRNGK